jgi:multiple sugar transport system permease protein
MKAKRSLMTIARRVILVLLVVIFFFPILWVILTSLKQPVDAFTMPPKWFFTPTIKHYVTLWVERPFFKYFLNSMIMSIGTVLISIPSSVLAGYYLSRFTTRNNRTLLFALLIIRMIPPIILAIPFFLIAHKFGLHDTYVIIILILTAFNQPFAIWLIRGFFLEIPIELDESAMIDGCSRFGAFWRIILPTVRPGIAASALFTFRGVYAEFLFSLILTGTSTKPLTVLISEYGTEDLSYWSISAAGATSIMIPIIIILVLLQKHLVRGLTFGAIKG